MDATEQRAVFDKLVLKAKRFGLLKFNQDGIAVLEQPPAPPPQPADTVAPKAPVSQ
jgi:hypothetical protein